LETAFCDGQHQQAGVVQQNTELLPEFESLRLLTCIVVQEFAICVPCAPTGSWKFPERCSNSADVVIE
jgi:hypothetical protein